MKKLCAKNFGIIVGLILVGILSLFNYSITDIGFIISIIAALVVTLFIFYINGDVDRKVVKRLIRYDMLIGFALLNNYILVVTVTLVN